MSKSLRTPEHVFLCQRLRKVRLNAGFTQADLAKRLDRPQSYVAKVETQERRLDLIEFVRWMVACDGMDATTEILTTIAEGLASHSAR